MITLDVLISRQQGKCYYCKCQMSNIANSHDQATIEHLIDKWSSPKHMKIEKPENLVSACYKCNNTRGSIRNKIARNYYKQEAKNKNIKIAVSATSSKKLHALFGPVPQHLFDKEINNV